MRFNFATLESSSVDVVTDNNFAEETGEMLRQIGSLSLFRWYSDNRLTRISHAGGVLASASENPAGCSHCLMKLHVRVG